MSGKIFSGYSYPPKRIEDNRSQFEKERDKDWNYIQIVRQMMLFDNDNSDMARKHLENLEGHFKERYGVAVDDYKK